MVCPACERHAGTPRRPESAFTLSKMGTDTALCVHCSTAVQRVAPHQLSSSTSLGSSSSIPPPPPPPPDTKYITLLTPIEFQLNTSCGHPICPTTTHAPSPSPSCYGLPPIETLGQHTSILCRLKPTRVEVRCPCALRRHASRSPRSFPASPPPQKH